MVKFNRSKNLLFSSQIWTSFFSNVPQQSHDLAKYVKPNELLRTKRDKFRVSALNKREYIYINTTEEE